MHVLRWFAWSSVHYTGWSALGRGKPTSHPAMAVALVAWVSRWRNFAGGIFIGRGLGNTLPRHPG